MLLVHTRAMGAGLSLSEQIGTAPGSWASVSGSSQVRFLHVAFRANCCGAKRPGMRPNSGTLASASWAWKWPATGARVVYPPPGPRPVYAARGS